MKVLTFVLTKCVRQFFQINKVQFVYFEKKYNKFRKCISKNVILPKLLKILNLLPLSSIQMHSFYLVCKNSIGLPIRGSVTVRCIDILKSIFDHYLEYISVDLNLQKLHWSSWTRNIITSFDYFLTQKNQFHRYWRKATTITRIRSIWMAKNDVKRIESKSNGRPFGNVIVVSTDDDSVKFFNT